MSSRQPSRVRFQLKVSVREVLEIGGQLCDGRALIIRAPLAFVLGFSDINEKNISTIHMLQAFILGFLDIRKQIMMTVFSTIDPIVDSSRHLLTTVVAAGGAVVDILSRIFSHARINGGEFVRGRWGDGVRVAPVNVLPYIKIRRPVPRDGALQRGTRATCEKKPTYAVL